MCNWFVHFCSLHVLIASIPHQPPPLCVIHTCSVKVIPLQWLAIAYPPSQKIQRIQSRRSQRRRKRRRNPPFQESPPHFSSRWAGCVVLLIYSSLQETQKSVVVAVLANRSQAEKYDCLQLHIRMIVFSSSDFVTLLQMLYFLTESERFRPPRKKRR